MRLQVAECEEFLDTNGCVSQKATFTPLSYESSTALLLTNNPQQDKRFWDYRAPSVIDPAAIELLATVSFPSLPSGPGTAS